MVDSLLAFEPLLHRRFALQFQADNEALSNEFNSKVCCQKCGN
jgi:hypothetical protein